MSWDIRIFRNRGIVRDVGSNDGDKYASSSSGEAMAIYLGQRRVFLISRILVKRYRRYGRGVFKYSTRCLLVSCLCNAFYFIDLRFDQNNAVFRKRDLCFVCVNSLPVTTVLGSRPSHLRSATLRHCGVNGFLDMIFSYFSSHGPLSGMSSSRLLTWTVSFPSLGDK